MARGDDPEDAGGGLGARSGPARRRRGGVPVGETLPKILISASDIERYAYCPLSWWLKRGGIAGHTEGTARGQRIHHRMGRDIKRIKATEKVIPRYTTAMWVFVLVAVLLGLTALSIFFTLYTSSTQGELTSLFLLAVATLWMIAAVVLSMASFRERMIRLRSYGEEGRRDTEAPGPSSPASAGHTARAHGKALRETRNSAAFFVVVAVVLALMAATTYIPVEPQLMSRIMAISALIWLLGTSAILFFILMGSRSAGDGARAREKAGAEGTLYFTRDEGLLAGFAIVASLLALNAFWLHTGPASEMILILFVLAAAWMGVGIFFFFHSLWKGLLGYRSIRALERELAYRRAGAPAGGKGVKGGRGGDTRFYGRTLEDMVGMLTTSEKVTMTFVGVALMMASMALVIHYQPYEQMGPILVVVTLAWLIGSTVFLFAQLRSQRIVKRLRELHAVERGEVEYSDTVTGAPRLLRCAKHNLSGRPDYIIKKDGEFVPVEIKTGTVPRGPYFSHVLQVAAYCILVEDNYDSRPPHGIVQYGNVRKFKVDYTDELKVLLIAKLQEMRECVKVGEAHRNHNRPGKCRHCSRRKECPERLDRPAGAPKRGGEAGVGDGRGPGRAVGTEGEPGSEERGRVGAGADGAGAGERGAGR